jgi:hypothetical protein
MPQLFKSPNSGYETDKSRPPPDVHFEDSFDEELDSLAKKTLFGSSDSQTDFGLDGQDQEENKFHKIGSKSKMGPSSVHKPLKLNTVDGASVEGGTEITEANFETKFKPKSTPTPRSLSRRSREVEKLCEDEMVKNMLRDIEERGLNKRRISAITYCKEFQCNGSDNEGRGSRRTTWLHRNNCELPCFSYELVHS